ncbi:MAG: hypothetical protein NVSMB6_32200 [Burkholderiaceae bacterium]
MGRSTALKDKDHVTATRAASVLAAALLFTMAVFGQPRAKAADSVGAGMFTLAAIANDYSARLKVQGIWDTFPLRVYFVRDAQYSLKREQEARTGFSRWSEATDNYISFTVVDKAQDGQMLVRFNPASDDGFTTSRFRSTSQPRSSRIVQANITIGVKRSWPHDVECIAAHEFGHALGINGHSDNPRDLMFPVHTMGTPWSITRRDLNTLAAIYKPGPQVTLAWTPRAG